MLEKKLLLLNPMRKELRWDNFNIKYFKKYNFLSLKERKFPHCLVAGIDKYPRLVTKKMGKKKIEKRTNIKPFVKYVNLNHLMPTRYNFIYNNRVKFFINREVKNIIFYSLKKIK